MNQDIDPNEKIEIVPETVSSTEQPFGYEVDRQKEQPEAKELTPEPVGLGIVSALTALPFPIVVALLWSTVRINVVDPEAGAASYTVGAIALFLVLIFVVPIATIFSIITGYVAFKRSQKIGRWMAAGSGVMTLVGIILLVLFITALQAAPETAG